MSCLNYDFLPDYSWENSTPVPPYRGPIPHDDEYDPSVTYEMEPVTITGDPGPGEKIKRNIFPFALAAVVIGVVMSTRKI